MIRIWKLLVAVSLLLSISAMAQDPQAGRPAQTGPRTDIYHVHFNKAALGQAAPLAENLKAQDPKAPMPGHYIVLRHQEGDDWDYCVIEHLGAKATVEISAGPPNPASRALSAWHSDTYAAGPPWPEFARAMGLGESAAKTGNSLYVVAVWRAGPGHRDELEQVLSRADPTAKVPISRILLQHLEGGAWNFLAVDRYNSWQDFATDESATVPTTGAGKDRWSEIRQHSSYHHDTLTDRIAPK